MFKKPELIVGAFAVLIVSSFVVPLAYLSLADYRQSKELSAEMQVATKALLRMGCSEKNFTRANGPDGAYNRLELACGRTVNDHNIRNLEGLTAVFGLDLSDARITDAGLESISGLTDLRYLQLSGTDITDAGLANLEQLKNLEALDLTDTRVTQQAALHLQELPKLKIVYAAGTQLSRVDGVTVDSSRITESWCGMNHKTDWESRGWSLAEK